MGICRWEWFDFRRLPFEDAFLNRKGVAGAGAAAAAASRKQQQEKKVAKIINHHFLWVSEVTLGSFCGAISMLFRPLLPWGFAAGSGSLLGVAASHQQQQQQQQ